MLQQASTLLRIRAPATGLHLFTEDVRRWVKEQRFQEGLLTVFCRHTSASLLIQENAAPSARRDLQRYFASLAPEARHYEHDDEGPDDMPAHLRAALTATQLSIPLIGGEIALGTWQGIYLFEHRREPPPREIVLHLLGEAS